MLPKRDIRRYLTPTGEIDFALIKPHLEKIYVVYFENISLLHKFLNFAQIYTKKQLFISDSKSMIYWEGGCLLEYVGKIKKNEKGLTATTTNL